MRSRGQTAEQVEADLIQEIRAILETDDDAAAELRRGLAHLLRVTDAHEVVREVADDNGLAEMTESIILLSTRFSEFAFLWEAIPRIERILRSHSFSLHQLQMRVTQLLETQSAAVRTPSDSAQTFPGCPYKGLEPFVEEDFPFFHGRERVTEQLVEAVAARMTGSGLLLLAGASGAGKTSLLRAGLLPCLSAGHESCPRPYGGRARYSLPPRPL